MAEVNDKIFGTGWSFPPTFSSGTLSVNLVSGVEDINQSLQILLSTALGERVKREDYGAKLDNFVFEPANTGNLAAMKNIVEKSILLGEPRIELNDILLVSDENEGLINIDIRYTILATNSRNNFVYPFYLKEGINL
ncbi:MAG: GPW/gp25 family protein [Bacteroidetes bacterium]|nr:GPW/gp25 family protein [Bacteroidota bacterium]